MQNTNKKNIIKYVVILFIIGIVVVVATRSAKISPNKTQKESYFGEWKISKVYSAPIVGAEESYASDKEKNSISENKIIVGENSLYIAGSQCKNLSVDKSTISTDDYLADFKIIRDPNSSGTRDLTSEEAGIDLESINLTTFVCDEKYYDYIYETPDKAIVVYKDTFFYLRRE